MEVVKDELITFAEAKRILENREKEKELGYEQTNALEYLKKFSKLSSKKAQELFEALEKIPKLKEKHKIMVINFMPEEAEDVRILFANEVLNVSEDERKTIASLVKKAL